MITNKYYGFGPEIRMIDERLTTVTAHQQLTQAGKKWWLIALWLTNKQRS
ncbi:hypothetical protein [Arcanobacterium hippocoleae]